MEVKVTERGRGRGREARARRWMEAASFVIPCDGSVVGSSTLIDEVFPARLTAPPSTISRRKEGRLAAHQGRTFLRC